VKKTDLRTSKLPFHSSRRRRREQDWRDLRKMGIISDTTFSKWQQSMTW